MPRFYCEYCDVYLKSASHNCRREHNNGRKHINNKIDHYTYLIRERNLAPPIHQPPLWLVNRIRKKMTDNLVRADAPPPTSMVPLVGGAAPPGGLPVPPQLPTGSPLRDPSSSVTCPPVVAPQAGGLDEAAVGSSSSNLDENNMMNAEPAGVQGGDDGIVEGEQTNAVEVGAEEA